MLRREVILGGSLTLLWGVCTCPCSAQQGAPTKRLGGCVVEEDEAARFFSRSTGEQLYATGNEPIIGSSGNSDFDYALALTLSRMTDVLQVLPGFGYYDDADGMNAYATPAKRMNAADGTVLFGKRMLEMTLAEPEHPEVGVAAVCAHEYGHILQYKHGLKNIILTNQTTVKRLELHADFLSGYFAGVRKLQKPDYPAAVYATKAYSIGDFSFSDRNHHGTPDERAAAIVRGFETGNRDRKSLADAIQLGINYVRGV